MVDCVGNRPCDAHSTVSALSDPFENGRALPSYTVRVETPDGTEFVTIAEDEKGKPVHVSVTIGKAGTNVAAWAEALSRLLTIALRRGIEFHRLLEEISNITSGNLRIMARGTICKSGPEGVLLSYSHANWIRWGSGTNTRQLNIRSRGREGL